jgi:S-DNA-T family DNA segregation ATPase FtsK/SpoIIIE
VVTGLIKSNMPCRVSFKVASGMDSRIVLDSKGAELLLGQGDMLYLSPRTSKLTRAQGTLVDDAEIRKVVRFMKDVAEPSYEPQLIQLKAPGDPHAEADTTERDPLFDDAVRVVLDSQRGSVSLLQRRLAIGYSRSSRLIEEIAEAGIIGAYKGSQAREVLMTLDEWEALHADAARIADANAAEDQALSDEDEDEQAVPDEFDEEYRG